MRKIFDSILKIYNEEPGRLFGLVYPYILFVILAMGLYYLGKLDILSRQTVIPVLRDSVKTADLEIVEGKETAPVDVIKASLPTADLLAKGKTLFTANCISCHGEGGNGDGTAGAALNPKPRNFHATDGWKNGRKITDMYKTLQEGIKGSGMAAYDYLPAADRFAIIHYVRSFMQSAPANTPAELSVLDNTYSLSKGAKIQGQIPTALAKTLVLKEQKVKVEEVSYLLNMIEKDNDEGALIFNRITDKKNKALSVLESASTWRKSEKEFASLISENIPVSGFNLNVHSLSDSEINVLYNYLNKYFKD
jgi:mono/diheme cytochrome c family protein